VKDAATRAHLAKERGKFERWMRKYWGGITLDVVTLGRHDFEYRNSSAQTAWEVWQKFNPVKVS
jgi:hypothetical protein